MGGIAGDAHDAFLPAPVHDRHVDARKHSRECPVVLDDDAFRPAAEDPGCRLVVGADPVLVPAGNDHSGFIHNIDVIFRILDDLVDKFLRHFRLDHRRPPIQNGLRICLLLFTHLSLILL